MQEIGDLSRQICCSYGNTMHALSPCLLHLVGVEKGGAIEKALLKYCDGYDSPRALVRTLSKKCLMLPSSLQFITDENVV